VDERHDLALLNVAAFAKKAVEIRASNTLAVGERVYAIGSPQGLELSLSEGIVSGLRPARDGKLIQTTAAISHGSSGGGLFDAAGHLIGITTFTIRDSQGLNFAIPAEHISELHRHPYSGMGRLPGPQSGLDFGRPAATRSVCAAPQYREFDFWLGEWDLVGADGSKSAEDKVVKVLGGCALLENWNAKRGEGMSISAYDPATRRWHQTLVDDSGAVLHLEGEVVDGKMVLIGRRPSQREKGVTITHRITWSSMSDHHVRQFWEASTNGGRTWRPVFEGYYVPRK
jgi:hypothetical protein